MEETNRLEVESIKLFEEISTIPVNEFWYGLPIPTDNMISTPEQSYHQVAQVGHRHNYEWNTSPPQGISSVLRRLYPLQPGLEMFSPYTVEISRRNFGQKMKFWSKMIHIHGIRKLISNSAYSRTETTRVSSDCQGSCFGRPNAMKIS